MAEISVSRSPHRRIRCGKDSVCLELHPSDCEVPCPLPCPEKGTAGAPAEPKARPGFRAAAPRCSRLQGSIRLIKVHCPLRGVHTAVSHVGECRGQRPCGRSHRSRGNQARQRFSFVQEVKYSGFAPLQWPILATDLFPGVTDGYVPFQVT